MLAPIHCVRACAYCDSQDAKTVMTPGKVLDGGVKRVHTMKLSRRLRCCALLEWPKMVRTAPNGKIEMPLRCYWQFALDRFAPSLSCRRKGPRREGPHQHGYALECVVLGEPT